MPQFIQLCLFLFEVYFLNKGLSFSLANIGFQRSERDSLVGGIVNDIFRERRGNSEQIARWKVKPKTFFSPRPVFTVYSMLGLSWPRNQSQIISLPSALKKRQGHYAFKEKLNRRAKCQCLCYDYALPFVCDNHNFKTLVNEPF